MSDRNIFPAFLQTVHLLAELGNIDTSPSRRVQIRTALQEASAACANSIDGIDRSMEIIATCRKDFSAAK